MKRADVAGLMARINGLIKTEVLVGIPDKNAPRTPEEDEERKADGTPLNNAELGYIHEFGVPERNIPARPFLIPGISAAKARMADLLMKGAKQTMSGDVEAGARALEKVGIVAEAQVMETINEGEGFAPLAAVTIKERERRGRTGTKPLIDTGQLRNSITHVIAPKEKT